MAVKYLKIYRPQNLNLKKNHTMTHIRVKICDDKFVITKIYDDKSVMQMATC